MERTKEIVNTKQPLHKALQFTASKLQSIKHSEMLTFTQPIQRNWSDPSRHNITLSFGYAYESANISNLTSGSV